MDSSQRRLDELAEANRRLAEAARLRDEFVALVSHELRTPMAVIKEGVSQLLDGLCGEITDDQRDTLMITLRNIDRLKFLIEDLLDISKIETGKMPITRQLFDLPELLGEISRTFRDRVEEKGLKLQIQPPRGPVRVNADRERIAQVLVNLVGNAVKFTDQGKVEVSLEERNGQILCCVSDTGLGIAAENLPKLFEKFQQFQRTGKSGGMGTGLGLAICKGIVELHGGKIWAESTPGQGSKFLFTLPARPAAALRRVVALPPAPAGFTLIEVVLATLLLVGGIAASTYVFSRGMYAGATVDTEMNTQALGLAEEKMEQIRGTPFGSIASEAKTAVSGWSGFSRDVTVSQPSGTNSDFKQVVVTTYWNSNEGELSTSVTSTVANVANG